MNWKFWNPRTSVKPVGNTYTLTPQAPAPKSPEIVLPSGPTHIVLTRKKWVMWGDRIAIVWDFDVSGNCTLHLTNPVGETVTVAKVRISEVRVARFLEIPEPRRRGLNQLEAAALGYF